MPRRYPAPSLILNGPPYRGAGTPPATTALPLKVRPETRYRLTRVSTGPRHHQRRAALLLRRDSGRSRPGDECQEMHGRGYGYRRSCHNTQEGWHMHVIRWLRDRRAGDARGRRLAAEPLVSAGLGLAGRAAHACRPLRGSAVSARLQAALEAQVAAGAPGALARIEAPRADLTRGGAAGYLARGDSRALRPDDAFRAASVTKSIHWHGLRVPAEMDGTELVQQPIQPGRRSSAGSCCLIRGRSTDHRPGSSDSPGL
jgi:hypothetical protein